LPDEHVPCKVRRGDGILLGLPLPQS
jgi:hypothetical protein